MSEAFYEASVDKVFSDYVQHLQDEQDVKEIIGEKQRDLDLLYREVASLFQKIHQPGGIAKIPQLIEESKSTFEKRITPAFAALASVLPEFQYYRYHQMFNWSMSRFSFLAALQVYLAEDRLVMKEEVCALVGIPPNDGPGFHLDLEDYLTGLTQLSNELSRFAVNSVTQGDYNRPVKISSFLNDLLNGFRLLNLKNDNLRKKFDSLKYDMKKVEEVVYDLSIRGLAKKTEEMAVKEEKAENSKAENKGQASEIKPEEGADGAASAAEPKKDRKLNLMQRFKNLTPNKKYKVQQ